MSESVLTSKGKDLIEPMIYYGPGSCPKCISLMMLADRETTIMDLNSDGSVSNIEGSYSVCMAICPNCNHKQPMMRCNGIYRPASLVVKMLSDLEIQEEIDLRKKNTSYFIEGNPLSL